MGKSSPGFVPPIRKLQHPPLRGCFRDMAAQARRGNGSYPGRKEAEMLNGTAEGCTGGVRQVEDWKSFGFVAVAVVGILST